MKNTFIKGLTELAEKDKRIMLLTGDLGTHLQEETSIKPKPIVEIGGPTAPVAHHSNLRQLHVNNFSMWDLGVYNYC